MTQAESGTDPVHMISQTRMTEAELLERCLAEDPAAQKELYDRYKRAMYTLAYRITGNLEDANDVLQDAFVKVFRGLAGFRKESTLGAWIKTIVVRTAYSKLRKQKVWFDGIEQADLEGHHHVRSGPLDAEYIEKAILALPEGYRTVFVLVEIEGYGHKEVADMLGISEGTSKSQLFHAKRKLREALKNEL